jgi:AraC-like DNA-binding protein/mannose-6-phosphate isomerase-like protein (cupin superfamily)
MKARFQHLGFDTVGVSILSYWVHSPFFGFHWHYHPELEITYVKKGRGTRLVGDHVNTFEENDCVLLGSNLPHTWISDDDFRQSEEQMEVIVVQFPADLFAEAFIQLPEMMAIRKLLKDAQRGISFPGNDFYDDLNALTDLEGFARLHQLMHILHRMSNAQQTQLLASKLYTPMLGQESEDRILNVCRYVHEHFTKPIRLKEIAQLANMNEAAFCRFFKKMTGQSLMHYVNDLRIGKACNMLMQEDKTISEVAYISGFNSQTHFNRSFLKRKGIRPSEFQKQYRLVV